MSSTPRKHKAKETLIAPNRPYLVATGALGLGLCFSGYPKQSSTQLAEVHSGQDVEDPSGDLADAHKNARLLVKTRWPFFGAFSRGFPPKKNDALLGDSISEGQSRMSTRTSLGDRETLFCVFVIL